MRAAGLATLLAAATLFGCASDKLGGDVLAVANVDREGDRLQAIGALAPIGDDVADRTIIVHACAKLADDA